MLGDGLMKLVLMYAFVNWTVATVPYKCCLPIYDAQARRWQAEAERATTELRAKADNVTQMQEQLRASSSEKLHLQV